MTTVKALGWFRITGRGTMVEVDMADADARGDDVRRGDHVRFELSRVYGDVDRSNLISADRIYEILSIEESRCLVNHGPGSKQCVMGRGLMVREVKDE